MLTDVQVRKAKPAEKPYKLVDGAGLHLYVTPAGGKLWRYRYEAPGQTGKRVERLLSKVHTLTSRSWRRARPARRLARLCARGAIRPS